MRMLGAKVVLTPRAFKGFGMYQKAVELAEANGWFLAHQFETKANRHHEATTAWEISAISPAAPLCSSPATAPGARSSASPRFAS